MGRSDSIVFFDKYIALSQIFVNLQICSNKTMIQSQPYKFFPEFVEVFWQSLPVYKIKQTDEKNSLVCLSMTSLYSGPHLQYGISFII